MTGGNGRDGIGITEIAIDVNRKNCYGLVRDQRFNFRHVNGIVNRIDITEYWGASAAHNCVGGGGKGKGRCNDFTMKPHGGDDILESQVSVGEQRDIWGVEIRFQFFLQAKMLGPHIGEKMAVPQVTDFFTVFFKLRHGGPGDVDGFLLHEVMTSSQSDFRPYQGRKQGYRAPAGHAGALKRNHR